MPERQLFSVGRIQMPAAGFRPDPPVRERYGKIDDEVFVGKGDTECVRLDIPP